MRLALLLVAASGAGCGDLGPPPPDAVRVMGCDDPALWSVPAIGRAHMRSEIGGRACTPGQYPLHAAHLAWDAYELASDQLGPVARTCWRVVAADPGSGWSAGQSFEGDSYGASVYISGFARSVTVEGRVLGEDGGVLFAIEPDAFALDSAQILDADAAATIAVASADAWAEPTALHLATLRIPTDEVVDVTALPYTHSGPITVERTSNGLVRRSWWIQNDQPMFEEVALGPGTRARIGAFGSAIAVDSELLLVGSDSAGAATVRRIPLGGEPREIIGTWAARSSTWRESSWRTEFRGRRCCR